MKIAALGLTALALTNVELQLFAAPSVAQAGPLPSDPSLLPGGRLDLNNPADALQVFRKLLCSVEDGITVYFTWQGEVFSRRPGEPDQHLFNVQGPT